MHGVLLLDAFMNGGAPVISCRRRRRSRRGVEVYLKRLYHISGCLSCENAPSKLHRPSSCLTYIIYVACRPIGKDIMVWGLRPFWAYKWIGHRPTAKIVTHVERNARPTVTFLALKHRHPSIYYWTALFSDSGAWFVAVYSRRDSVVQCVRLEPANPTVWKRVHSIGPTTEKARRPNMLRWCRGTINWQRLIGSSVVDRKRHCACPHRPLSPWTPALSIFVIGIVGGTGGREVYFVIRQSTMPYS